MCVCVGGGGGGGGGERRVGGLTINRNFASQFQWAFNRGVERSYRTLLKIQLLSDFTCTL